MGDVGVPARGVVDRTPSAGTPDARQFHDRLAIWMTGDAVCCFFCHSSSEMRTEPRVTPNRAVKARIMFPAYVIRGRSAVPICTVP